MATYGLTDEGFIPKTFEVIRAEINQVIWDTWGNSLDLSDRTPLGQLIAIIAVREAALWEALEAAHAAMDPDAATGSSLRNICSFSGTLQNAATSSVVALILTGAASTLVSAGNQVSVDETEELFQTLAAATLAAATAWAVTTAYTVGALRSNDTNIYVCTVAGTSAGAGGPTGETTAIVDGTVTWRYVGDGLAYAEVSAASINTGPITANAFSVSTKATLVSGWESVLNLEDAAPGQNLESAPDLRVRREVELTRPGSAPKDAIRADLLDVAGVTTCTVFNNTEDTTDADGVPPHTVECLVSGGTDQDIIDQIHLSKGACTGTYGTTSGNATDSQGVAVPISFSRPVDVDIYVEVSLTYDETLYPVDGDTKVKEAIAAWGAAQATGKDAVSSAIKGAIFKDVVGVLDVVYARISTTAGPTLETTIPISTRERALYDTSRVTVISAAGTP